MSSYPYGILPLLSALLLASCFPGSVNTGTDTDTGAAANVDVLVFERDATTGCWPQTTEQWPEEFWGQQVSDTCNENDISIYFQRGDSCYRIDGTCDEWHNDPEVTVCQPPNATCCGSEEC